MNNEKGTRERAFFVAVSGRELPRNGSDIAALPQ